MNNIKCVVLLFLLSHILSVYAYVDIHPKKIKNTIIHRKEFFALQSDTSLSEKKISYVPQDEKKKHSRIIAALLTLPFFFYSHPITLFLALLNLGFYGTHRFYLKRNKSAIIMSSIFLGIVLAGLLSASSTIIFWGLLGLWAWTLIDFILILLGVLKFKDGTPTEW